VNISRSRLLDNIDIWNYVLLQHLLVLLMSSWREQSLALSNESVNLHNDIFVFVALFPEERNSLAQ